MGRGKVGLFIGVNLDAQFIEQFYGNDSESELPSLTARETRVVCCRRMLG